MGSQELSQALCSLFCSVNSPQSLQGTAWLRCCQGALRHLAVAVALAVTAQCSRKVSKTCTWGQATFLSGLFAAAAPDAALQAELEALPQEALETRCGPSSKPGSET